MRILLATFLLLCFSFQARAEPLASPSRFVAQQKLPGGRMVVVAEGDGEPRSTGSYSVRLYSAANPEFPFDDFIVGAVLPRDGSIERLAVEDVDGDEVTELVVVVRSAGSGGYLSADAIRFDSKRVEVIRSVEGLSSDADPIAELRKATP
ncbi:MAG: PliI family lysozyme inhibitor of I-type lysozyme [Deltaproteobacteria bacterium]|nr:PliI family lysozyme inhibitor of I-type lysozyme [Deltaproteobacteria bacterium]MBW2395998.1 PliI family lysozyme inhibitor of I-type lysozyme [Deltaproteobacteria bacterium]